MSVLRDEAVRLARLGYTVLPVFQIYKALCGCKIPDCTHSPKTPDPILEEGSHDPDEVASWDLWDYSNCNLAIKAGGPLFILNIVGDDRDWFYESLTRKYRAVADAPTVFGPDVIHVYLAVPPEMQEELTHISRVTNLPRHGNPDFSVVPPSRTTGNRQYIWHTPLPHLHELPEAPRALLFAMVSMTATYGRPFDLDLFGAEVHFASRG